MKIFSLIMLFLLSISMVAMEYEDSEPKTPVSRAKSLIEFGLMEKGLSPAEKKHSPVVRVRSLISLDKNPDSSPIQAAFAFERHRRSLERNRSRSKFLEMAIASGDIDSSCNSSQTTARGSCRTYSANAILQTPKLENEEQLPGEFMAQDQ